MRRELKALIEPGRVMTLELRAADVRGFLYE